ncbi:MAG: hypothetical protein HQL29_04940 [Candidatus Omnitrophica bacterium]|nr:hypothetical protein [Candidatus Omnitrophota bacterium]
MELWRMALAYLYSAFEGDAHKEQNAIPEELAHLNKNDIKNIFRMIEKQANSPKTSSAGRLFDAVSALCGICPMASYEAEGAILLEKHIACNVDEFYNYSIYNDEISVKNMIKSIVCDGSAGIDKGIISAKFHNTIGEIIFDVSKKICDKEDIKKVLLSGGCFQNKYLTKYLDTKFYDSGMELVKHKTISCTDAGLSVGQAVCVQAMK